MYNRAEELKNLFNLISEFSEAIYDDGILRDIRFKFEYQKEMFLYIYKFDYSNPRLYRFRKGNLLTEVKEFIIPKEIKQRIATIQQSVEKLQEKYYPLIPNQELNIGKITYKSKYLNEYANSNKEIDFISSTFIVLSNEEKINEFEINFSKESGKWTIVKDELLEESLYTALQTNIAIFKNELLKKINSFEDNEVDILEIAQDFLFRTDW